MTSPVKLTDIIEGMDFQSDEGRSYLNTATGEVISITDETLRAAEADERLEDSPAWQQDTIRMAKDMLEHEHYLALPSRFDIYEYRIMERFCDAVDDDDIRNDLCHAIRGRGAFRRFKGMIQAYGMTEAWYRYRDATLREIAMVWCDEHDIPYPEPES